MSSRGAATETFSDEDEENSLNSRNVEEVKKNPNKKKQMKRK